MPNELKVTGRILPISEATRTRNPEIFRDDLPAGVCASVAKSDGRDTGENRSMGKEQESVCYWIEIVVCRPRLLDSGDNAPYACKALRDCIALALGFSNDDNPRLTWNYHQIKSKAKATIVRIYQH